MLCKSGRVSDCITGYLLCTYLLGRVESEKFIMEVEVRCDEILDDPSG